MLRTLRGPKAKQLVFQPFQMDVSKNRGGPPKWMVYNGNPIKMDDLRVFPYFWLTPKSLEVSIFFLGNDLGLDRD